MSNGAPWPSVNREASALSLDLAPFCTPAPLRALSPLDAYYSDAEQVLERSRRADVADDPILMRLLVMEVVSAAEYYFRTMLSAVVSLCPEAGVVAMNRQLTLGSVAFYGRSIALGILDGVSLAAAGEVGRQTKNALGLDIPSGSPLAESLAQFEKVCQLRHAVAHSGGYLGAKNVTELAVDNVFPCAVTVDFLRLQHVVAVGHNAARSFNSFVFERTLERWVSKKRMKGLWRVDKPKFERLLTLCHSSVDNGPIKVRAAYDAMRTGLKAQGRL